MHRRLAALLSSVLLLALTAPVAARAGESDVRSVTRHTARQVNIKGAASTTSCAIIEDASVECWGYGGYGVLGDLGRTNKSTPVASVGVTGPVRQVRVGAGFACALTTAGGVECWGVNRAGQLGNGTRRNSRVAVPVTGLGSGVVNLAVGWDSACAVLKGGIAKCWGANTYGQLGDGTTMSHSTPAALVGLGAGATVVKSVSLGLAHGCAVLVSGNIWCWGSNSYGQLGTGNENPSLVPTQVQSLPIQAKGISAGLSTTCALNEAGAVSCGGRNSQGGAGTADRAPIQYLPTAVTQIPSGATSVSTGYLHTCAVVGGQVLCWGWNDYGQLGLGVLGGGFILPTAVPGLSGVTTLSSGERNTCAVGPSLWCWGANDTGQVGDGTQIIRTSPTPVVGLSG